MSRKNNYWTKKANRELRKQMREKVVMMSVDEAYDEVFGIEPEKQERYNAYLNWIFGGSDEESLNTFFDSILQTCAISLTYEQREGLKKYRK